MKPADGRMGFVAAATALALLASGCATSSKPPTAQAAAAKCEGTLGFEAGPGAVGLFYFAGHGLQSYGTNYLLAIDAPVEKPADIPRHGFEADDVLRVMLRGGADTNILILDACRPNHVATILRPVARAGLREIDARGVDPERSVMIAYSTGLGENAADGDGDNGPYAKALADNILVPDLPLEAVFRRVRAQMVKSGSQKPWESNAMLRSFAFIGEAQ